MELSKEVKMLRQLKVLKVVVCILPLFYQTMTAGCGIIISGMGIMGAAVKGIKVFGTAA